MASEKKGLKTAALVVAILFALGVVCTATGTFFFGSSKARVLFENSTEILAADPQGKRPRVPDDGGAY